MAALSSLLRLGSVESCVETDRVFNCERCVRQVRVCRRCDRGQRYCRRGCARQARTQSVRRAGAAYQLSFRGRVCHAQRQSRYRERERQKVTHHGFSHGVSPDRVDLLSEKREVDDDETPEGVEIGQRPELQEGFGHRGGSEGPEKRAECCSWCGAVGQRLVRFGYWRR